MMNSASAHTSLGAPYVVAEGSQLHTKQFFGTEPKPLLDQIDAAAKRLSGRVVKLHIAAKDNATVDAVAAMLRARYYTEIPAVTCMVGDLFSDDVKLGIDAVIAFKSSTKDASKKEPQVTEDELGRVLHPGARVYVSGQAEKAATATQATLATMQSLQRSLKMVDATLDDVVQVKAFLNPISADKSVRAEIETFFGGRKVPVVIVQWSSTLPIEIELIASCPAAAPATASIEYLTPPGMTASPLYARMTKLTGPKTIYVGGLFASGTNALDGESEVKDIFASFDECLKQTDSDFEHLVKATYYCANDDTSKALNTLRPNYYNPARPPAASKAIVNGVGQDKRFITVDMIASPAK